MIPGMPEGGVFAVVEPSFSYDRNPTAVGNAGDSTAVAAAGACTPGGNISATNASPGPKPPPPPCRILGKWQHGPPPGMLGMPPPPRAVPWTKPEAVHGPKPPPPRLTNQQWSVISGSRPIVQAPSASANPQAEHPVPNTPVTNYANKEVSDRSRGSRLLPT